MPNLVINKVPSSSGSAGNLVIDKYTPSTFTESVAAEYSWRWEDDPTMSPLPLGSTADGVTLAVPFDLMGRSVRLFLVSVTADGRRSVSDVRLAEQEVFTPSGDGGILTDLSEVLIDSGDVLTDG